MSEENIEMTPLDNPNAGLVAEQPSSDHLEAKAWSVAVAGWLLPGLGHALQRMWGRAVVVFLSVGMLVVVGSTMRGNLFSSNGADAFDTLGYVADLGTGSFYFLARAL